MGKKRKEPQGCEEGEEGISLPNPVPIAPPLHTRWPWGPGHIPHPRDHLDMREAPMREGREVRGTVSSLGEASQGVDLTGPSILVLLEIDGVRRI